MTRKHGAASLAKTTKRHSSYTKFATEGVIFLSGLAEVNKIVPSVIRVQSGRRSGYRSLRINQVENGGLELKFSSGGTQTIYLVTRDRDAVVRHLREWSFGKGNCLFHIADSNQ
ncbi:MAG: hypothetical protein KA054_02740 [Candidatus Moranbacteria bacterium]|nr:hypothetical protein [Candidatus Moranbacteria bacterium]